MRKRRSCRNPQVQPCFLKSSGLFAFARAKAKRFTDSDGANRHTATDDRLKKNASANNRYRAFPDWHGLVADLTKSVAVGAGPGPACLAVLLFVRQVSAL